MSPDITITVNGQEQHLAAGTTVTSLLEKMSLKPEKVAVELNRRLVRSPQYSSELKAGDKIEIVTFVGGG